MSDVEKRIVISIRVVTEVLAWRKMVHFDTGSNRYSDVQKDGSC